MLHKHELAKAEGTIVSVNWTHLGPLRPPKSYLVQVALPGEAPISAEVDPLKFDVSSHFHYTQGESTAFLVDTKSHKVRFDEEDPRNTPAGRVEAARTRQPAFGQPAFGRPGQQVGVQVFDMRGRGGLAGIGGAGGLAGIIEMAMESAGMAGAAITQAMAGGLGQGVAAPSGPRWDVPSHCPNCGAQVDQATASYADDPRCAFCQQAIPVTPHAAPAVAPPVFTAPYQAGPVSTPIDRSHDVPGTSARILAEGQAVTAKLVSASLLPGTTNSSGEEVMALAFDVDLDGGGPVPHRTNVACHVPDEARHLLIPGTVLPGKVMSDDLDAVAIDWQSAVSGGSA